MPSRKRVAGNEVLPTHRVRADLHIAVLRVALVDVEQPFTADDVARHVQLSAHRVGLVWRMWCSLGLLARAPGRGVYRIGPAGEEVARAWRSSDSAGRRALEAALEGSWFARIARKRLEDGPALARGLVAELLANAGAEVAKSLEAEALVDIMIEAGLLSAARPGYLAWRGDEAPPRPTEPAESRPARATLVPPPRDAATAPSSRLEGLDGLAEVLSRPMTLADVLRLSAQDLAALQHHAAELCAIVRKIDHQPQEEARPTS